MQTRILVADDHRLFREGLVRTLLDNGFDVVGQAPNGEHAVTMTKALKPDVVMMDVSMPECDGIEALERLREEKVDTPVIILTMHTDTEVRQDAKVAKANAYLTKDCSVADIVSTINKIVGSSPNNQKNETASTQKTKQNGSLLSTREIDVLQLVANGCNVNEVGTILGISHKTVQNHMSSCYDKLDVTDRTQAVVKALQKKIITLPKQ